MRNATDFLNSIVDAWEALPGGGQVRNRDVEQWLADDMAPAINAIRGFLCRPKPDGTMVPPPEGASPVQQMVATSDPIAWAEVYDGKIVTVQLDRSKWHTSPLYLSAPADHVAPHVDRDYPEEFEAWWKTYRHKNRDPADYSVKKQIAFDAFYFGAQGLAPVQREGDR